MGLKTFVYDCQAAFSVAKDKPLAYPSVRIGKECHDVRGYSKLELDDDRNFRSIIT